MGHDLMTPLALILDRCGLSVREAAAFLGVRQDTVKSWRSGRHPTPPGAIKQARELHRQIEASAGEAIKLIARAPDAIVEIGLATSDADAQSLGWPCVGACAALAGVIAARSGGEVRIVARGATAASAAAAKAHTRS